MAMMQPIRRPVEKLRPMNVAMSPSPAEPSDFRTLPDHDRGADRNALVEIAHVGVGQTEAAGRHRGADGLRLIGAVDSIHRVAEIECARAERIARTPGHPARQIRLALDHLLGRRPVRPLLLLGDLQKSLPLEAVAADADAVADRAAAGLHHIKIPLVGVDDDGAGRFGGAIEHHGLLPFRIELLVLCVGDVARLVAFAGAALGEGLRRRQHGKQREFDAEKKPKQRLTRSHGRFPSDNPAKSRTQCSPALPTINTDLVASASGHRTAEAPAKTKNSRAIRDRKSTRLNYSHAYITY